MVPHTEVQPSVCHLGHQLSDLSSGEFVHLLHQLLREIRGEMRGNYWVSMGQP